jgi:hypothetical protein
MAQYVLDRNLAVGAASFDVACLELMFSEQSPYRGAQWRGRRRSGRLTRHGLSSCPARFCNLRVRPFGGGTNAGRPIDTAQHGTGLNFRLCFLEDLAQYARTGGGNFYRHLVRFDFQQRLIFADLITDRFEPRKDL